MDRPPAAKVLSVRADLNLVWNKRRDMPTWVGGANCVWFEGKLYVGGGSTIRRSECQVLVYTPSEDSWEVISTPTCNYSLAVYRSQLVLVGGCYPDKELDEPTNKIWLFKGHSFVPHPKVPEIRIKDAIYNVSESPAVEFGCNLVVAHKGSELVLVYNGKKWLASPHGGLDASQNKLRSAVSGEDWYLSKGSKIYRYSLKSLVANAARPKVHYVLREKLPDLPCRDAEIVLLGNDLLAIGGINMTSHSHSRAVHVLRKYSYVNTTWECISEIPGSACHDICCGVLETGELLIFGGKQTLGVQELTNVCVWKGTVTDPDVVSSTTLLGKRKRKSQPPSSREIKGSKKTKQSRVKK